MSFDGIKQDFWESTARSNIREKCTSIFNQELLSDVTFVVRGSKARLRSESKKIPVHKFVLAISSPVFYAMFYGEMAEKKDNVEISDCEYESLLELFRFMYGGDPILTADNVMQLLYLAKKYMLPSLADKCSAYLQENLDASSVFHVLPHAQKYEDKDLLDHCWKLIDEDTEEVVKTDGFVAVERSTLEELVERESLSIKEVELFKAVDRWAENECEKQGLREAQGPEKRRLLGERIVKGIRFPVMEQNEFASVVLDCDILTKEECFDLMKYFSAALSTPVGFKNEERGGWPRTENRSSTVGVCGGYVAQASYWQTLKKDRTNYKVMHHRLSKTGETTRKAAPYNHNLVRRGWRAERPWERGRKMHL